MPTTEAQKQHQELMAAALAQIEHIKSVIERSAQHMDQNPKNWGITGDMGAILARLNDVTA